MRKIPPGAPDSTSLNLNLTDISHVSGQLVSINPDMLPAVQPALKKLPWRSSSPEPAENTACRLDEVSVLNIPCPGTPEEEKELVRRFLVGMRKLFSRENNWTTGPLLESSLENCVQCNSCASACHLYEMSGCHPMYRPIFRSEIFRRIYRQYIRKEPFAKWRYGSIDIDWKTVLRLGELAYRCNLCRRCAQNCPMGVDNALIAREIRKLFSQELGIHPVELHKKGSMKQLKLGSATGMSPETVKENVKFIDEEFSELAGLSFTTPFDVQGADILLLLNAGEILAWPENVAAFSLIFQEAGLSWTLSSKAVGYDAVNYGLFYDDAQLARVAMAHMQAARELGVKKIVVGECGHAHKALTVMADRIIPYSSQVPRESCYVTLRDIIQDGRLKLEPARNNFPVTLHDPCNVVRLMGIVKPQRDILKAIAPNFREMTQHGVHNYCCGGGSGFALMTRNNIEEWRINISGRKKMEQIGEVFRDCLGPETKKYICAPCSNCKAQIRDLLTHGDMYVKNSFAYGGLVELIVNCMSKVRPGFIKWNGEE